MFTISLFGCPAVLDQELTGALAPTVLGLLALRCGSVVEAEVLIDQVYGYDAPASAAKTLQNQIVKLRKALEPTPVTVETVGSGYRMVAAEADIDVLALEVAIAAPDSEHDKAAQLDPLREVWRARPFSGCRPAPWLEAAQARLSRLVSQGVIQWSRGTAAPAAVVVEELEWALGDNPFVDDLWVRLTTTHLDEGSVHDALAVLERAEWVFDHELGATLPASLRTLRAACLDPDRAPTSDQRATVATEVLVGRSSERSELLGVLERVRAGAGAIVLLEGEAGIGKTSLCRSVAEVASEVGFSVGWGRSWLPGQSPPFWAWRESMAEVGCDPLDVAGDRNFDNADLHPELCRLFTEQIQRCARDHGPMLLILEDLHDADRQSADLLLYLTERVGSVPLMVLVTMRSGIEFDSLVGRPFGSRVDLHRVALQPWSSGELAAFAKERLGEPMTTEALAQLEQRSGGNPFLADRLLARADDSYDPQVPQLLASHLAQLRPDVRAAVAVTALMGGSVQATTLATVLERSVGSLAVSVRAGEAAGFLRLLEDGTAELRHATIESAIPLVLDDAEQRKMHQCIAAALALGPIDDLARTRLAHHHLEALAPGELTEAAVAHVCRVADDAMAAASPDTAAMWLGRAREAAARSGNHETLADLLLLEGRALGSCGSVDEAVACLHRAADIAAGLDDAARCADLAVEMCRHRSRSPHRIYQAEPELVEMATRGLAAEPDATTSALLHAALAREAAARGAYEVVAKHAPIAVAQAELSGDDEALARAYLVLRMSYSLEPERIDQWCELSKLADEHAARTNDKSLWFQATASRLIDAVTTADVEVMAELGARDVAHGSSRSRHSQMQSLAAITSVACTQGRYDDARHHLAEAQAMSTDPSDLAAVITVFFAQSLLAADTEYDDFMVSGAELGAATLPAFAGRTGLAMIYANVGRVEDARRTLFESCNPDPAQVPRDDSWLLGLCYAAYAGWLLDDDRHAAALHELLRPFVDLCANPSSGPMPWAGSVAMHAAAAAVQVGRLVEADDLLKRAEKTHRELGATPWVLRTLLVRASMLNRRDEPGDRDAAQQLIDQVRAEAAALGATAIVRLADQCALSDA